MLRPASDRINTATFFMIIEKKNPQTVKDAYNSHQTATIKDNLDLNIELMLPEQKHVTNCHSITLNYEEALELFVLLSRRISDVSRDYSSHPNLAHRYVLRLQDIQTKVVSLLDSFNYENREN